MNSCAPALHLWPALHTAISRMVEGSARSGPGALQQALWPRVLARQDTQAVAATKHQMG